MNEGLIGNCKEGINTLVESGVGGITSRCRFLNQEWFINTSYGTNTWSDPDLLLYTYPLIPSVGIAPNKLSGLPKRIGMKIADMQPGWAGRSIRR